MDFDSRWKASSDNCQVAVTQANAFVYALSTPALHIHPNPSNGSVFVNWLPQEIGNNWVLYDALGRVSAQSTIKAVGEELNFAQLPQGLYILQTAGSSSKIQIIH
jgi:hypothetical protein